MSTNPDGPFITLGSDEWGEFMARMKGGEFSIPGRDARVS
jgi:hypothetical protein